MGMSISSTKTLNLRGHHQNLRGQDTQNLGGQDTPNLRGHHQNLGG